MQFLLTGTYNSGNKGDAAMELAAAQGISSHYPDSEVTILSPFPELDRPFYAPTPVEHCNRRRLIVATVDLIRAMAWRWLSGRGLRTDWLLSPGMRRVRDSDLVIDLSGDMLTEDYGPHVAYSHYIPILRALILGRPYFLCAQSIGPFRLTRPLARLILNRAAAITPRDRITYDYLKKIGVTNDRIVETADLAFLLAPAGESRAAEILTAEDIALDHRPLIGISVSHLIEKHYRMRNPGASGQDFAAFMKVVIERAAATHNAQVLFIAHVTGPSRSKDDRVMARKVREALDPDVSAWIVSGDYRPDELKALIARCSVFCGARMHANIAALSACVPTVAISYSHKTPGIMSACGLGDFVAPVESMSVDSLGALLARAFSQREALCVLLKARIADVRANAMKNVAAFAELAAPGPVHRITPREGTG
jgi:colanic acid/amylovoran biosynthesis protein